MKKIFLSSSLFAFACLFSVGVVFAQTTDTVVSPKPTERQDLKETRQEIRTDTKNLREDTRNLKTAIKEDRKAALKNFKEERQQKIEELRIRKEELKKKFEEKRAELKDKRYEKFVERVEKITTARRQALERLDLIAQKIQARIDKLSASGADVSAMQAALDACQTVKSTASGSIDDSESGVSALDFNATNAKDLAQAQVSAIHSGNQALKSYHSCLKDVIKSAPKTEVTAP